MQRASRRFWLGWALCAGLVLVLGASGEALEPASEAHLPAVGAAPPASAAVTIVGKVEVRAGDAGERRLVQIVAGHGDRRLIVDEVGAGRAMVKHVGERVSATGVVSRRKDGREVLQVSSFRPLGG